AGGEQLQTEHHGEDAAQEEANQRAHQIEDGDPLVVVGQQPGADAGPVVQVALLGEHRARGRNVGGGDGRGHCSSPPMAWAVRSDRRLLMYSTIAAASGPVSLPW